MKKREGAAPGYKSPPSARKWKPGQSGNPRGRSKDTDNLFELSAKILSEPVSIRVDGKKSVEFSVMEAAILKLAAAVLKGGRQPFYQFMSLVLHVLPGRYASKPELRADYKNAKQKLAEMLGLCAEVEVFDSAAYSADKLD